MFLPSIGNSNSRYKQDMFSFPRIVEKIRFAFIYGCSEQTFASLQVCKFASLQVCKSANLQTCSLPHYVDCDVLQAD